MHEKSFDFPLGLRPWPNPLRLRRPLLREGYTLESLEHSSDAYRLTAMLGAAKVERFVRDFAALFPAEAFVILEFYEPPTPADIVAGGDDGSAVPTTTTSDQESGEQTPVAYYSPYLPVAEILAILTPYLPRLIHDGFVGFGLANNRAGLEMFYSEEKVLTCFTDNHLRLTTLFAANGLQHRDHLLLPSDFGHDHLSLLCHHRSLLPPPFATMSDTALDYVEFCRELVVALEMYPVEETLSFFLSRHEQEAIAARLAERPELAEFTEEDFGVLLFDWHDFVKACSEGFEGDLEEYLLGLQLRDVLQFVMDGIPAELSEKLREVVADDDARFRRLLTDQRKRLDPPQDSPPVATERFWRQGVIETSGATLRRDLIRNGWFSP